MEFPFRRSLIFAFLLICGSATSLYAQLVVENTPRWGFDGRVRLGQFNLLEIDVANSSDKPWQGDLKLQPMTGMAVDIPLLQPDLYIEPFGRRTIQFFPYIAQTTEFDFRWGRMFGTRFRAEDRLLIDEPKLVEYTAIVQLISGDLATDRMDSIPGFDERSFPTSAAGLDGLGQVILNHVPPWSEAQQRAFLDWIYAGGKLELFQQTTGKFPEFSGILSELDEPSDKIPLGNGIVTRHGETIGQSKSKFKQDRSNADRYPEWQVSNTVFPLLREMTQPDHNWPLIYLLAISYLLLLFPGCWLLGRKRGDYRLTYGAILGLVLVFSFGFHTVGARGYGETTSVNSVALAKPASNDRMIVTQVSNVFITSGGMYEIKHKTEGSIYSTGQIGESVLGAAYNRPVGAMVTDIPSFSSRSVVHAGVLQTPALRPELVETAWNGSNPQLTFELTAGEEWSTDQLYGFAAYAGTSYPVRFEQGRIARLQGGGMKLSDFFNESTWRIYQNFWDDKNYGRDELFRRSLYPLIAQDLNLMSHQQTQDFSLPEGEVRLYIFTKMPEAFFIQGEFSEQQHGHVLRVFKYQLDDTAG